MAVDGAHHHVPLVFVLHIAERRVEVVVGDEPVPAVEVVQQPGQGVGDGTRRSIGQHLEDADDDADDEIDGDNRRPRTRFGHDATPLAWVNLYFSAASSTVRPVAAER